MSLVEKIALWCVTQGHWQVMIVVAEKLGGSSYNI